MSYRIAAFRRLALAQASALIAAAAFAATGEGGAPPRIAVVIDDFGLSYPKDVSDEEWMKLPWPMTFAVMPDSPRTRRAAEETREAGKELIIHFPFDPFLSLELSSGGPSEADRRKISGLLRSALKNIPNAAGINNHRSFKATRDRALMRWFASELKPLGLYFLDSRVSPGSVALEEARGAGLRAAANDVFLDGDHEPRGRRSGDPAVLAEAIRKDKAVCLKLLRRAAGLARRRGAAIAIGHHYYHGTFECLSEGIPELRKEGFEFVFASRLAE